MEEKNKPSQLARVITLKKRKRSEKLMTEARACALPNNDVDVYMNEITGTIIVRKGKTRVIRHKGDIPGVGPIKRALLVKALRRAPASLTSPELGYMAPSFDSHHITLNNIQAVAKIRKHVFQENAKNARFFLTSKPFRLGLSEEVSLRLILRDGEGR